MFTMTSPGSPLTLLLQEAGNAIMGALITRLAGDFPDITPVDLTFFGALDCGATHAAGVAQRLGISRQAVSRTARELEAKGLLRLCPDPDRMNHNLLVMTERGEALAREGRKALAEIEAGLGEESAQSLRDGLYRLTRQLAHRS